MQKEQGESKGGREDEWDDEDQGNTGRGNRTIQAVSAPVAKQDLRPKQPKNVGDLYDE